MEVDPMEYVKEQEEKRSQAEAAAERNKSRLNSLVAITVALLATFMGICKVKDDNIVQAMQQAQAEKIDRWNYYQARNIREAVYETTSHQFALQAQTAAPAARAAYQKEAADYEAKAKDQSEKKEDEKAKAEKAEKDYDKFNFHDDQFDLADALLAVSIALLAVTSLTQKKWLYAVAMVPTFFGVLMGVAGLFGLNIHSDYFAKLLGT